MASLQSDNGSPQAALPYPAHGRWSLQAYEPAVFGLALLAALALAWLYLVGQAAGMGNRAGTMGLGTWAFLGMWAVMVVAMMFPSVGPTGFRLAGRNAAGLAGTVKAGGAPWRLERATAFMIGYFIVWVAFGLAIYGVLTGAAGIVSLPAHDDKWVAAAVFAVAGVYQFTPAKRVCRERCWSPRCAISTAADRPSRRSVIWESADHALSCVGCCWAFMAVLIAIGLMNLVAMAVLTVAILVERYFPSRALASYGVGVLLIAAAALTPFFGWLHPGLSGGTGMPMPMHM
jgi:predicted metal-binding membrane protein